MRPRYFDAGTLYASVDDSNHLFRVPVTVTALGDGSYALRVATDPAAPAGLVTGTLPSASAAIAAAARRRRSPA